MAILQLSPVKVGQAGVQPSSYKMLDTNSLTTITAAGYLKQGTGGQFFNKNDLIDVIASYGTPLAENAQLYVTISNGVITLNVDLPEGLGQAALKNVSNNALPSVASVSGATVVGHVAKFADTTGTVVDGGVLPTFGTAAAKAASDNTSPTVASVIGTTTLGNVAIFQDATGSIIDGGALGQAAVKNVSDNTKATVVSASTPFVVGHLLQAADVGGTAVDAGFHLTVVKIQAVTGGAATTNVVNTDCLTTSLVLAAWITQTNPASIQRIAPLNGSFNVVNTADPGASQIMYIIIN